MIPSERSHYWPLVDMDAMSVEEARQAQQLIDQQFSDPMIAGGVVPAKQVDRELVDLEWMRQAAYVRRHGQCEQGCRPANLVRDQNGGFICKWSHGRCYGQQLKYLVAIYTTINQRRRK